jgi:hypothetical protein
MTDQHRANPADWLLHAASLDDADSSCILELRDRIEALEATQHAHADLSRLSDAEREQVTQELAKPAAWRPLDIETTYGSEAAADAAQILRAPIVVEGTFEHGGETYRFKAKPERVDAMTELRAASAEARPAGLVERDPECVANWPDCYEGGYDPSCCRFPKSCSCEVRRPLPNPVAEARPAERLWERMEKAGQRELDDNPHAEQAEFYEAMIREVAAWLRENDSECQMGGDAAATAELLEQEADRR